MRMDRMDNMDARVLTFEDAIDTNRKRVWIQLREMSCAMAATFVGERLPFLRFRDSELEMEIEVRADYYGKTWRCFDSCPLEEDWYEWDDKEEWARVEDGQA